MERHNRRGQSSRVLTELSNSGRRRYGFDSRRRILWVDITIEHTEELDWVHDKMMTHAPCIAMVTVTQTITTYYTGAAVDHAYHLTTIGKTCYDLMCAAFESSSP